MINDSIKYYEMHAEEFTSSTLNVDVSSLYAEFEKNLKNGYRIMDLGCGSGRDSKYFSDKGYDVIAVDPSPKMCAKTRELAGVITYNQRAEKLEFENEFDAVWACASLLHVSRINQKYALRSICRSLKQNGVLYCSWKYGNQDRIENGRQFTDLDETELISILSEIPELKLINCWISQDVRPNCKEQKWLNALLRKA